MNKLIKRGIIGLVIFMVALILIFSTLYTVKPNTTTIVLRMGAVHKVEDSTGLKIKAPFIDQTVEVYTGDNMYDMPVSDVITSDKKSMITDDFVVWQVTDPILYYRTLGAVKGRAEERIEAAVYNATKNTISSMTQEEIIASRGNTLTNLITTASNRDISQYGIQIKTATIKALDLPEDNKNAVYERMISERNNIAAGYTAQGEADARLIKNDTDKQVREIIAEADRQATILKTEGETEYMKILSDAYSSPEKAEFYAYLRGLDALTALANENNTMILDKDSEFAKILYGE